MTKKHTSYQPISCDYYDILEALALQGKQVTIRYRADNRMQKTEAVIRDIFARNGAEYLRLDDERLIRLDHLVEVDGRPLHGHC